jgi:hypothetical protein
LVVLEHQKQRLIDDTYLAEALPLEVLKARAGQRAR